jgi:hypothetical protein
MYLLFAILFRRFRVRIWDTQDKDMEWRDHMLLLSVLPLCVASTTHSSPYCVEIPSCIKFDPQTRINLGS